MMSGRDLIVFRLMCVFCPLLLTISTWYGVQDPVVGSFVAVCLGPFLPVVWIGCIVSFVKARNRRSR
jgi:hypothetical protein